MISIYKRLIGQLHNFIIQKSIGFFENDSAGKLQIERSHHFVSLVCHHNLYRLQQVSLLDIIMIKYA